MLTFGFITLSLEHETTYFTEVAKRAAAFQIQCFRFIPSAIRPGSNLVEGEKFDYLKEKWVRDTFPFPQILYDRCFYGQDFHSKRCHSIVSWLKEQKDVQFLGHGLPNKRKIHQLLKDSKLAPYIPKTFEATSPQIVLEHLRQEGSILLKPINGSQGNGIYCLEKHDQHVTVRTDKKEKQISKHFHDEERLRKWLERIFEKADFLLQPYLPLTNDKREPFDIRALLQKSESGKWRVIGKGIRCGQVDGIISNLQTGAEIIPFTEWLQEVARPHRQFIQEELNDIYKQLPIILEQSLPPLFELGIDIGIARDSSIWILDINSKPGRQVLLKSEPTLADTLYEGPLRYAQFLMGSVHSEK